jgi:predicted ATPase
MTHRIVLTGAPASGKSTALERLKTEPALSGFTFFEELARQLLMQNPDYRNDWAAFHYEIYRRQVERENELDEQSFITDRGTADAFAFHPETMQEYGTTIETEYARYTSVIQLGSAAGLDDETLAPDEIRNESVRDILKLEEATRRVWENHPGYHFVPAEPSFEHKLRGVLALVLSLVTSK